MADLENTEVNEVEESPQGETETGGTDWKAEARKWERLAKKAHSAEVELEQLKQSQMTEQEKANARAEAAEQELAKLKAEKERIDAASKISGDTGIPLELLMFCRDEEAMTEFAKAYAKETHVSSAPSALAGNRIVRGSDKPKDNAELFAEFASSLMK